MKQAIVWASFGVADAAARARCLDSVAAAMAAAHPGYGVFQAYTSDFIRRRMRQAGLAAFSLEECLGHLRAEGYGRVFVQPAHLTPGEEYDNKLCAAVRAFRQDFSVLALGEPVFFRAADGAEDDFLTGLSTVRHMLPVEAGEALVLLGHGSPHRHNPVYEELQRCADRQGWDIHIGVVEVSDTPDFPMVAARLRRKGAKSVLLAPLLLAGGRHVTEDMAGEAPSSWKSRLEREGLRVRTSLQGLGEYPAFRAIYLKKLQRLLAENGG